MNKTSLKKKGIIFDFDYTLVDATKGIVMCINYALTKLGYEAQEVQPIRKTVGYCLRDAFTMLTGNADSHLKTAFANAFLELAASEMTKNTELLPYTVKTLSSLQDKDIIISIVTSKNHFRIIEGLKLFGITHLVDHIVGVEDVSTPKPDPEGTLKAFELMSLNPDAVIYVGDSIVDAITAQSAGVDFIGVTTGTTIADEFLAYPHIAVISSLDELIPLLIDKELI